GGDLDRYFASTLRELALGLGELQIACDEIAETIRAQIGGERLSDFAEAEQANARIGRHRCHTLAGTKTSPLMSLRLVRSRAERSTFTPPSSVRSFRSTVKKPVGCSTSMRSSSPALCARAMSAATEPGRAHAVATLTAPSTPIDSCTRCGMNVRVAI